MLLQIFSKENKDKKEFYTDQFFVCSHCNKKIYDILFVVVEWIEPPNPNINYYHIGCGKHIKNKLAFNSKLYQFFTVNYIENLPVGVMPVILEVPEVKASKGESTNLFEMATRKETIGSKIIDKTKHSYRESIEGARIGADVTALLEEKDKEISVEDVLLLVDKIGNESKFNLVSNTKLIEEREKRLEKEKIKLMDNIDSLVCQNCGSTISMKRLGVKEIDLKTICYECLDTVIFPYEMCLNGVNLKWLVKEQYKEALEKLKQEEDVKI